MDGQNKAPENGGHEHYTQLILTLDVTPEWHLDIRGNIASDDTALAALQQAVRYFEAKLRAQQTLTLQKQLADAARTQAILNSVREPHHGN